MLEYDRTYVDAENGHDAHNRFATTAMSRVLTCSGMAQHALKYDGCSYNAPHAGHMHCVTGI